MITDLQLKKINLLLTEGAYNKSLNEQLMTSLYLTQQMNTNCDSIVQLQNVKITNLNKIISLKDEEIKVHNDIIKSCDFEVKKQKKNKWIWGGGGAVIGIILGFFIAR